MYFLKLCFSPSLLLLNHLLLKFFLFLLEKWLLTSIFLQEIDVISLPLLLFLFFSHLLHPALFIPFFKRLMFLPPHLLLKLLMFHSTFDLKWFQISLLFTLINPHSFLLLLYSFDELLSFFGPFAQQMELISPYLALVSIHIPFYIFSIDSNSRTIDTATTHIFIH